MSVSRRTCAPKISRSTYDGSVSAVLYGSPPRLGMIESFLEAGAGLARPGAPERTGKVRRREFALELVVRAGRLVRVQARLRLAVRLEVTQDQVDVGRIARLPGEPAAQRVVIVAATVRHAGDDGLHPAVVLVVDEGEPALQVVAERAGDGAVDDHLVEAAVREVGVALEFLRRRVRDELDRAARRVPAEQRALRAAQRLDAREVEDREAREVDRARVAVVLVHGDRGFLLVAVVVLRDAADVEHDLRARVRVHAQVRHGLHDVGRRGDVEVLQRAVVERRHRDADVLDVLLAALRGDHDFLEGRGRTRLRGRGRRRLLRLVRERGRRAAHERRAENSANRGPDIRFLIATHDQPPRSASLNHPIT